MKQKLAIACGLLHTPSALILDEPLTGLDPAGIRRMRATIAGAGARRRGGHAQLAPPPPRRGALHAAARDPARRRCVAIGTIAEIVAGQPQLAGQGLEDIFLALTGDGGA